MNTNKKWFTVKHIKRSVWGIGEFQHQEEVISYLVVGSNQALLIDTGLGIQNIKSEVKKITDKPIMVVNTHSHFDHVGDNYRFSSVITVNRPHSIKKVTPKNNSISMKPFSFEVIKTPGHSPDSICLYERSQRWLFAGDTLYKGPIYLHLPESNKKDYIRSIKKIMNLTPLRIFPGHNSFSFPYTAIGKIFAQKKKITAQGQIGKKLVITNAISLLL